MCLHWRFTAHMSWETIWTSNEFFNIIKEWHNSWGPRISFNTLQKVKVKEKLKYGGHMTKCMTPQKTWWSEGGNGGWGAPRRFRGSRHALRPLAYRLVKVVLNKDTVQGQCSNGPTFLFKREDSRGGGASAYEPQPTATPFTPTSTGEQRCPELLDEQGLKPQNQVVLERYA